MEAGGSGAHVERCSILQHLKGPPATRGVSLEEGLKGPTVPCRSFHQPAEAAYQLAPRKRSLTVQNKTRGYV